MQLLEEQRFEEAIRLANSAGEAIEGLRHIVCMKCLGPDVAQGHYEKACETLQRFRAYDLWGFLYNIDEICHIYGYKLYTYIGVPLGGVCLVE